MKALAVYLQNLPVSSNNVAQVRWLGSVRLLVSGRATNYIYGSAKAGFTAFLSGLRNRLVKKGVHVMTVLPGFVAARMTEK